ncbi:hypothetical protein NDU88_005424 [Pleurodeles waltl]|uniref:Uncharacterized protein n=1 Tax=Pleurodeles waltl TaxID=8319 RepID=A0AAV7TU87_PLEWA|nr:hypothetical protein NDU88_005424 [Pleurodeles waltl]
MRHSVDQALVQAIQPIKHHLLGLVDQQAWSAPVGALPMGELSFSADSQSAKQIPNPHAADFQSLLRNMAREHDYNAGSLKKAVDAPASSSASSGHSSEQEDAPPLVRIGTSRRPPSLYIRSGLRKEDLVKAPHRTVNVAKLGKSFMLAPSFRIRMQED